MKFSLLIVVSIVLFSSVNHSYALKDNFLDSEGNYDGLLPILDFPFSARALSHGEAYTALSNDAASVFYNPAALGQLTYSYASLGFQMMPFGNYLGYLSFVKSPADKEVIGFAVSSAFNFVPSGISNYDASGNVSSMVVPLTSLTILSLAVRLDDAGKLLLGLNGKFIYDSLGSSNGIGGGLDIAVKARNVDGLGLIDLGVMLQNLPTLVSYSSRSSISWEDPSLRIGAALLLGGGDFTVSLDLKQNLIRSVLPKFFIGISFVAYKEQSLPALLRTGSQDKSKEFPRTPRDRFTVNLGLNTDRISGGLTLTFFGIKWDVAFLLGNQFFNDVTVMTNIDFGFLLGEPRKTQIPTDFSNEEKLN